MKWNQYELGTWIGCRPELQLCVHAAYKSQAKLDDRTEPVIRKWRKPENEVLRISQWPVIHELEGDLSPLHRRRSGWNSEGDAWRARRVDRCRMGGVSSRLGGLGSVMNGFYRILKAAECSFLYLYDKNLRGTICTSVPLLRIMGGLVPRVPPVIYAHGPLER